MSKYKTGQDVEYGDFVRGVPNNATNPITGIVVAHIEGLISIVFLKPGKEIETARVYGESKNFDLVARNEPG